MRRHLLTNCAIFAPASVGGGRIVKDLVESGEIGVAMCVCLHVCMRTHFRAGRSSFVTKKWIFFSIFE